MGSQQKDKWNDQAYSLVLQEIYDKVLNLSMSETDFVRGLIREDRLCFSDREKNYIKSIYIQKLF